MENSAELKINGNTYKLPIVEGSEQERSEQDATKHGPRVVAPPGRLKLLDSARPRA